MLENEAAVVVVVIVLYPTPSSYLDRNVKAASTLPF